MNVENRAMHIASHSDSPDTRDAKSDHKHSRPADFTSIEIGRPTSQDGAGVFDLVARCKPLDENSMYCNLLQCSHFADTSVVTRNAGQVVGCVSGYIPPNQPDVLFIWQVAVDDSMRGLGLAKRMIANILERPVCTDVVRVHTTITPDNPASQGMFQSVANSLNTEVSITPYFERDDHFQGAHETEMLWNIGPFQQSDARALTKPKPQKAKPLENPMTVFDRLESEVQSYARSFPTVFERAEGAHIFDQKGRQYIDFLAGAGSLNYGHNNPMLRDSLVHYITSNGITHGLDMHTTAKAAFLRALEDNIFKPRDMEYVVQFTGPTGTNAVEAALKIARRVKNRDKVISFTNGFHGVSLGSLALTGNRHHRDSAGVTTTNAIHMPYDGYMGDGVDTTEYLDKMLSDTSSGVSIPAAVFVECIQGEGGINAASAEWLRNLEQVCRKHDILLVVDDIQAGNGRSGDFFSFEEAGISPDIITLSKSLSGFGLPLAVVLIKPEFDIWKPGEHNGTFRGNNHAFVTAAAALNTYWKDDAFITDVREKGTYIKRRLTSIMERHEDDIIEIRGRGMMRGIVFKDASLTAKVCAKAFENGLIIETSGPNDEVVKTLCPLTIEKEVLADGLSILEKAIEDVLDADKPVTMAAE